MTSQAAPEISWEQALAPNTLDDPYALTEEVLRSSPPLFYHKPQNERLGTEGIWIATRFDICREIFQNNAHYTSGNNYPYFKLTGDDIVAIPLQLDPPEHTRYRALIAPYFSPQAIKALEPKIAATVNGLIDTFTDKGECDAAHDFGRIYPVRIFMELMGFPQEMFDDFLAWSHPMHFETHDPERMMWGTRGALDYVRKFAAEVSKAPPNSTVASHIVHGRIDGRPLTEKEIVGTIFFLWDGGMDTVAATHSLMFRRLALDPALQRHLREQPALIPRAIEEFLRMNPTVNTARSAKVDHELAGHKITAGDRLLCLAASANFDPEKYEDPRTFRTDRSHNHHLTFVAGAHRCLGMHLARCELRIALGEFLRRIPEFRLKPGAECMAMPGLLGAPKVPVVW